MFPPNPAYKEEDASEICLMRKAEDNREERHQGRRKTRKEREWNYRKAKKESREGKKEINEDKLHCSSVK